MTPLVNDYNLNQMFSLCSLTLKTFKQQSIMYCFYMKEFSVLFYQFELHIALYCVLGLKEMSVNFTE